MLVSIVDLGCAKNTIDSERSLGVLLEDGFEFSSTPENADLIIINTCGFIESAKQESIDNIFEILSLKGENPNLKVVAIGCLVKRYGEALANDIPEIDGLLSISSYDRLAENIQKIMDGERVLDFSDGKSATMQESSRLLLTGKSYAYLQIADGCDNCCSYCAIPLIRGSFRSRKKEHILKEAKELADYGVKELCLVAQDITNYGNDCYNDYGLAELLKDLLNIKGTEFWIRLLYAHPAHLDDKVIDLLAKEERLLKYLDLPIQHINDRILSEMGRKVTKSQIIEKIEKLKEKIPELTLRTSLICGFPGETDEEFEELCQFVNKEYFQYLGAFAYSPEEDTPAFSLPDMVDEEVSEARVDKIMEIQQKITFNWLDTRLGSNQELIIDNIYENEAGQSVAICRSRCEAPEVDGIIYVNNTKKVQGDVIRACLNARNGYDLEGVSE